MKIPMEDWLRGCVYHDGRNGEVTLPTDKVLEIANYIQATRTSITDGMIYLPPNEESRTMTRKEAIEVLNNKGFMFCDTERCGDFYNCDKCDEALIMAKEALLQEPIIRCKDCKYYQPFDKNEPYDCYSGMSGVKENDYCSFAEPKGSDEE